MTTRISGRAVEQLNEAINKGWSVHLSMSPAEATTLWGFLDKRATGRSVPLDADQRQQLITINERLADAVRSKSHRAQARLNGWTVRLWMTPIEAIRLVLTLDSPSSEGAPSVDRKVLIMLRDRLAEETTEARGPEEPERPNDWTPMAWSVALQRAREELRRLAESD
jgi:hypothetical protein